MEKNYYLDIIKSLEPGVVIFDEDMNVLHLNNLILSHFPGFTKDQVFSVNILEIHSEGSKEKIREMIKRISETGEQVVNQFKIQSYNHEDRYFLLRLIKLYSAKKEKQVYLLMVFDVTKFLIDKMTFLTRIPAPLGNEIIFIPVHDIVYFEASNIYTKCYTKHGKEYLVDFTMTKLEEKLDNLKFYRVHRSYIVNMEMIEKISKLSGKYDIILIGANKPIPISQPRLSDFLRVVGIK
jgi:PAS domain S-box-containing protein